ncbi:MAG: phosphotransferase [Hamadaea sp.]|uniref:phosphotransferase n=1 Tax=Hamadaea sp. TaxID=2024425 RepID=UPI001790AF59|nr:phosphotransferase [Hamadaea sp.]NUR69918.1 phosphotransferase [Hamadaea sp.]NUT22522.1 phosphotransferase [Hamadaea sp.]
MARLPYGFLNETARTGDEVVKTYVGVTARERRDTELAALRTAAPFVPVPQVVRVDDDPPVLRLAFVPGVNAVARLESSPLPVLGTLGACVRDFQRAYADAHNGQILVHGDCGPQNFLLSPTGSVVALLDWEWAHPGPPITDIAWLEWVVRHHYPAAVSGIPALYEAYGTVPPWPQRHAAMLSLCEFRLGEALRNGESGVNWHAKLAATQQLTECLT